jgi:hypothetical protein
MLAGGEVNLDRDATVEGSLTSFCGSESIDGHLGRDLLVFAGEVNIIGNVGGGVRVRAGELNIDSSAQVAGPVNFKGDKPAVVSPNAKLASPVQFERVRRGPDYSNAHYYIWQVIWAAAYILYGLVLMVLMPNFSDDAIKSAERYGAAGGLGVLVGFGVPIAACIACVTVVGLFIGLATLAVWYGALHFGLVVVGALVGKWLMGRTSELWPLIGRMVVGVLILRICTLIPHIGVWVKYLSAFWGMGAISLALYQRFQPMLAPNIPSAPHTPTTATVGGALPA